jgi:hypothetical protein
MQALSTQLTVEGPATVLVRQYCPGMHDEPLHSTTHAGSWGTIQCPLVHVALMIWPFGQGDG